jgi:uncharacterized protein YhbP (UPF0306 family)
MAKIDVRKAALAFLKKQKLSAFSTITPDGKPQTAMVYYGVDHTLSLYVVTGHLSRKFKNLSAGSRVAMAVADPKSLVTVQLEGWATVIQERKKNPRLLKLLSEVLEPTVFETIRFIWDPVPPVVKMKNGKLAILKFEPDWIRYADFSQPVDKTKGRYFQEWRAKK